MKKLSPETVARIKKALKDMDDPESEISKRLATDLANIEIEMADILKAVEDSEHLTDEDLDLRINCKP